MEAQLQQGDEDWTPADEGAPAETAKRFGRQAHDLAQSNALIRKRKGASFGRGCPFSNKLVMQGSRWMVAAAQAH